MTELHVCQQSTSDGVFVTHFRIFHYPVSGRVVNVSSSQGSQALENCSEDLQEKFRCETLTEEDLVDLMKKFVEDTKNEVHEREGWPNSAYGCPNWGSQSYQESWPGA